ncbi:MAG: arsenosugar biosynthesis radical SAM (seleno)protein ArsS [Flavobacteriaceae bacterium]
MKKSLKARRQGLADPAAQREWLSNGIFDRGKLPLFSAQLQQHSLADQLRPKPLEILQLNLGYMCNQVCAHCHVDAGPDRKEMMSRETLEHCLRIVEQTGVHTLDLTGGAPEMHPDFRWLVERAKALGVADLIVRSNLTILRANATYRELPAFFAEHGVHVVSSLPFYKKSKTDRQRGDGVFEKSIEALTELNALGYGQPNSGLALDLVYNPAGAFLPGDQLALEADFKKALSKDFGIVFNRLFTITNLPISRFLEFLIATDNYEDYMQTLVEAFNPAAVSEVMCRNTLSVRWDGVLFDCDFNQMLDMPVQGKVQHIRDFAAEELSQRNICISQHCYGCTAGAGSSCQGAVT